jgi:phospholipid-binding lipoprotein MlaA
LPRLISRILPALAVVGVLGLAGCSTPSGDVDIHDPYEDTNRSVHEFNKGLDRAVVRPTSHAINAVVPRPIMTSVGNFADNLGTPASIMNDVLQGDLDTGTHNFFRFVINTTVGIGGLFDAAGWMGLEERKNDFGQTLAVWGVPEGAYQELPILGPSTERATAGLIVDLLTDPVNTVLPNDERATRRSASILSRISERDVFGEEIDAILYDSADSYAQLRSIYLQNRRFQVSDGDLEDFYIDPFEGLDAQE